MATINQLWIKQLGSTTQDEASDLAVDSKGNAYIIGNTYGRIPGAPTKKKGEGDVFLLKYDSEGNQLWARQIGLESWDQGASIAVNYQDEILITGYTRRSIQFTESRGSLEAWVAKYDSEGALLWVKAIASAERDVSFAITSDQVGNTFVTGFTDGTLDGAGPRRRHRGQTWIAKLDSKGAQVWVRQFSGTRRQFTEGTAIGTDGQGGVYVGGLTFDELVPGQGIRKRDAYLTKYNSQGQREWLHQIPGEGNDQITDLVVDVLGNVYVVGETDRAMPETTGQSENKNYRRDIWLAKYNFKGDHLWTKQLFQIGDERKGKIALDEQGNILIGSTNYRFIEETPETIYEARLTKLTGAGDVIWTINIGNPVWKQIAGIGQTKDGQIYVTGKVFAQIGEDEKVGGTDFWIAGLKEVLSESEIKRQEERQGVVDYVAYVESRFIGLEQQVDRLLKHLDLDYKEPLEKEEIPLAEQWNFSLYASAELMTQGQGDGRISYDDARVMWWNITRSGGPTAVDKKTLDYLKDHFNFTDKAWSWLQEQFEENLK